MDKEMTNSQKFEDESGHLKREIKFRIFILYRKGAAQGGLIFMKRRKLNKAGVVMLGTCVSLCTMGGPGLMTVQAASSDDKETEA